MMLMADDVAGTIPVLTEMFMADDVAGTIPVLTVRCL